MIPPPEAPSFSELVEQYRRLGFISWTDGRGNLWFGSYAEALSFAARWDLVLTAGLGFIHVSATRTHHHLHVPGLTV